MGGKFINTNKTDMLQSSVNNIMEKLDNPYMGMMQEKGTTVIWFNRNSLLSTVDEGSKLEYEPIGSNSPTKYNKINNLVIYGIKPTGTSYEVGDFGIDSAPVTGEILILPDTIIPYMGDYFIIPYMKEKCLFKITDIESDTFQNDGNYYKASYVLSGNQSSYIEIQKQIADTFTMIYDNIGTNYKCIIKSESYDLIQKVDKILLKLKKYYKTLFYDSKVQTMIFTNKITGCDTYDPYLIEFLIRNNILSGSDDYLYIGHQCSLDKKFSLYYDKSFLHCVENKDLKRIGMYKLYFISELIDDITSIFDSRFEDYYKVTYEFSEMIANNYDPYCIIDASLLNKIITNELYSDSNLYLNIIIKYFNSIDITIDDLENIDYIEYDDSIRLFYYIPIIIYIIESYVKCLLMKHEDK